MRDFVILYPEITGGNRPFVHHLTGPNSIYPGFFHFTQRSVASNRSTLSSSLVSSGGALVSPR